MEKRPYKAYIHQKQLVCDVLAIDFIRGVVVTDTPAEETVVDGTAFYEWEWEWRFDQVDLLRVSKHVDQYGTPYVEGCIVEICGSPNLRYEVVYSEEYGAFMKKWIGNHASNVLGKGQMEHLFPTNTFAERIIGTRYTHPEWVKNEKEQAE